MVANVPGPASIRARYAGPSLELHRDRESVRVELEQLAAIEEKQGGKNMVTQESGVNMVKIRPDTSGRLNMHRTGESGSSE